ncbi:MAG: peptidoglycan DD-metalloendopeptidase family protein [Bacteroidales bacterium]|nr:peptidoglycan DD-metalloendopeptidase family protein [Bacteroidales bacterium]
MKKVLCIVLVAVLTALGAGAQSSSVKRLESLRAQLENDIKILNRQLDQNIKNSNKVLSSLTLVRRKINAREQLIATYDKQLKELNDSLYLCQKELGRLQARHDTLSLYYSRLVRGAYKNRDTRLWYMYILSSDSMGQAFNRFDYFRNLSTQMSAEALKLREASAQLEAQKQRLNKLKAQVNETRKKVVSERSQLQSEEGDASRMVSQLKKDRRTYEKQLKEKNRQKEELNRKIAELIRQQTRKQGGAGKKTGGGSSKTTSTAVDTKLSNEFAANKGRLPWPVEGTIMERFGKHSHPVYKNVQLPQNNGVTLVVKHGAQAKAVFNGTVSQIVVLPGYNQCVLVNHGEYFTLYSKLKSVSVKAGQKITVGQVVGTVDTIGGEDLFHFELWKGSTPQNPESWLRQ